MEPTWVLSVPDGHHVGPMNLAVGDSTTAWMIQLVHGTELILGLRPANERRCYLVTRSLIGWAQA